MITLSYHYMLNTLAVGTYSNHYKIGTLLFVHQCRSPLDLANISSNCHHTNISTIIESFQHKNSSKPHGRLKCTCNIQIILRNPYATKAKEISPWQNYVKNLITQICLLIHRGHCLANNDRMTDNTTTLPTGLTLYHHSHRFQLWRRVALRSKYPPGTSQSLWHTSVVINKYITLLQQWLSLILLSQEDYHRHVNEW